ncbi:hypothetical protein [Actinomadura chibensis]|uniref:Secreted protein n=1 Tax=Actinomadura chibensis TaxID=392828 RepID=A0A5D0NX12_9ACTN|nr:hypothetical protein [Actinomadura chibensis]TYB49086.1 hypothetical protein FXF69_08075 [Actinomadura chibensis]
MKIRKHTLALVGVSAAALALYGGAGSAFAGTTGDEKPKPPVTCSLKADAGPFVAASCMGEGAVQLNVVCPAEKTMDGTINMFMGRSTLLDNRCAKGPTFASLTMFDMSTHKPGETLVPLQEIA